MSWYAATRPRALRQVAADAFVIVWVAVWWWVSRAVHDVVDDVAEPARSTARAARGLADDMTSASEGAGGVPLVGEALGTPFGSAAGGLEDVVASATEQAERVERVADVVGWVVLLIPVAVLVALWLPVRLRFLLATRAARSHVDAAPDLDLFALRAMATQPMPVLARISDDPVGAWRRGDREVVTRLAEIELRRVGLRLPPELAPQASSQP